MLSRRHFTQLALTALPGAAYFAGASRLHAAGKPNSKVAGVQLGLNVPYSFAKPLMTGDEILADCVELGISGLELRTQPVETFLGMPPELARPKKGASKDEAKDAKEKAKEWRKSVSMDKV